MMARDYAMPVIQGSASTEFRFRPRLVTPHAPVIALAAEALGVEPEAVLARDRHQPLVRTRALVVWLLRAVPSRPMAYQRIGDVLGGLDHSTVINLHCKAIELRLRDREFRAACRSILVRFFLTEEDVNVRN
jgi:chromosomal replication initiation ATPase DnaA